MAAQLKLVRLADFAADIDSIDLLASGYSLAANGYQPVVAPIGAQSVFETITLELQGTSTDDLAAMVQDIDEKIKQVQWWIDNPIVEPYQIYLRVQVDEESSPRQAQILNIEPANSVNVFSTVDTSEYHITEYQIGIERTPFWEHPYSYPATTAKTDINCIGGKVALSETINGDLPARLARFDLKAHTGGQYFGKFWAGWRTSRLGDGLEPVWSLSDGQVETDTTSGVDATAYNGNSLTCTFATVATLTERVFVRVSDITINASEQVGRFTVLLRARMSDSSVAQVRAKFGWVSNVTNAIESPIFMSLQPISGTSWKIYEMGSMNMPPIRNVGIQLINFGIGLDARRISGSGSLLMDCLVLIPTMEGFVKIETASDIGRDGGLQDTATVFCAADMTYNSVKIAAVDGVSYDSAVFTQIDWALPANSVAPRLIVCATDTDGVSTKAETLDMSYTYIPRWRTLRGNVT